MDLLNERTSKDFSKNDFITRIKCQIVLLGSYKPKTIKKDSILEYLWNKNFGRLHQYEKIEA